jgi:hypothetical protein
MPAAEPALQALQAILAVPAVPAAGQARMRLPWVSCICGRKAATTRRKYAG